MGVLPAPMERRSLPGRSFDPEATWATAKPGDVCNKYGDIRGCDVDRCHVIIKRGVVWGTKEQFADAERFRWRLHKGDGSLVQIARD